MHRYCEYNLGHWQGLTSAQVDERYPSARQERESNKWDYVIPGGEGYRQAHERTIAWLSTISEDSRAIAIAHEMIGRTIRGAYAQLSSDKAVALNHPHNKIFRLGHGDIIELMIYEHQVSC